MERALEARRALLALHDAAGDELRAGDDERWLVADPLVGGARAGGGRRAADRAIARLEAFPDSRELAMALSAPLAARDARRAPRGGDRARHARRARSPAGSATARPSRTRSPTSARRCSQQDDERGPALLEEAFALATEDGHDDHAARALVNLATAMVTRRRGDPRIPEYVERALRFVRERELDGYIQYLLGVRANLRLLRGAWRAAEADARASLALGEHTGVSLCPALIVLGRLQRGAASRRPARRSTTPGGARSPRASCSGSGRPPRRGPSTRGSRATSTRVAEVARPAYELAAARGDAWARAELAHWLWRAGEPVRAAARRPGALRARDGRRLGGRRGRLGAARLPLRARRGAQRRRRRDARLEALARFEALGALRSAAHLRRRLRAAGVRRIPRGPRAASRAGPAGLTPRETEVLDLIVRGATNAEIAQELVISPKTVDHHVSAVLAKLGVGSRREAGAAAERLGAA